MTKLTAKTIDAQKLGFGKKEIIVYDEEIPGFGLRIREGGSRTLVLTYKIGKQSRRLALGPAVKEAFPDVRKRALDLIARIRLGDDPAVQRDASRAPAPAVSLFTTVAERFLAQYASRVKKNGQKIRPKTVTETERYLLTVAKPLHSRPAGDITKRHIADVLSSTAAASGDASANRLQSALSAMFVWAMGEGLIDENPVIGTNRRGESARNRCLIDDETGDLSELVRVWNALDGSIAGDIIRLLILTGQRRNEIAGLRWSELDEGLTRIKLPPERTKNGRPHIIPLSEPARDILTRRPRVIGWQCVFSSSATAYASLGQYKEVLDRRLPDVPPWRIHDLRRTASTGMSKLKVLPHVKEAVLNHAKPGIEGVYDLNTYLPEKVAALTLWAEQVMAAVTGEPAKVVPLRA